VVLISGTRLSGPDMFSDSMSPWMMFTFPIELNSMELKPLTWRFSLIITLDGVIVLIPRFVRKLQLINNMETRMIETILAGVLIGDPSFSSKEMNEQVY
jgi:hypothetical protein